MIGSTEHVPARLELEVYEERLPHLLSRHEGEYVVIKGQTVHRFFVRYEEALQWAYETFGLEPFFVKRVADSEQNTAHFTRDVGP